MNRTNILLGLLALVILGSLALSILTTPQEILAYLNQLVAAAQASVEANPILTGLITFVVYTAFSSISFPGMITCTILVGVIFGVWPAVVLTAVGGTIGNSISFVATRYFFREAVQERWQSALHKFDRGLDSNEFAYLMVVRLLPVAPYYLINVAAAVSRSVGFKVFAVTSFLGNLPKNYIFASAGANIHTVDSLDDLLSTPFVLLMILGFLPIVIRLVARRFQIKSLSF